jgi:hypothetical protein
LMPRGEVRESAFSFKRISASRYIGLNGLRRVVILAAESASFFCSGDTAEAVPFHVGAALTVAPVASFHKEPSRLVSPPGLRVCWLDPRACAPGCNLAPLRGCGLGSLTTPGCRDNWHPPCHEVRHEGGAPAPVVRMIFSRE